MKRSRSFLICAGFGAALFMSGVGMRVYAQVTMAQTETRLLQALPDSPASIAAPSINGFAPADAAPTYISIPALGLWNRLEAVDQQALFDGNAVNLDWAVADAGWHIQSGWPGWHGNVVIAGHSPSRDTQTWSHSIFRQLAYLTPGDHIEITAGTRNYTYAVDKVFAIPGSDGDSPPAVAWLAHGTTDRLTLVTCWPPHTAAYRVIVVAQPVSTRKMDMIEEKEH